MQIGPDAAGKWFIASFCIVRLGMGAFFSLAFFQKINKDHHLGKTRFKMALDHYDEVIWVNLFCRSVSTQQNLRIKIILILLRSKMKKTSIQTLAKFTNVLILTFCRETFTLFLCFSYG